MRSMFIHSRELSMSSQVLLRLFAPLWFFILRLPPFGACTARTVPLSETPGDHELLGGIHVMSYHAALLFQCDGW